MRCRSSSLSKMACPCVVSPRRAARPTYCSIPATDVVSAKDLVTTTVDAGTLAPHVNSLPAVTHASLFWVMLSWTHCVYTGFEGSESSLGSKEPAPARASICHRSSTGSFLMLRNSFTVGSTRGMVWAFSGRLGHQRFKNCSDWITRSGENFSFICGASSCCSSSSLNFFSLTADSSCFLMSASISEARGNCSCSFSDIFSICSRG
mmetsp:Transcript_24922/g.58488  ORF Transcript_24922/g.58488 Transcript_24922/m.58488 type:complete len:206 (+) Transcript_24922:145-762(+)